MDVVGIAVGWVASQERWVASSGVGGCVVAAASFDVAVAVAVVAFEKVVVHHHGHPVPWCWEVVPSHAAAAAVVEVDHRVRVVVLAWVPSHH